MKRATLLMAALAFLLDGVETAQADVALEFTSGTNYNTVGSYCLGWSFTPNATLTVTSLGFFDSSTNGGSGLSQSHAVGIFDSSGNLLVSATVLKTDSLSGHFRYDSNLSSAGVTLTAGNTYNIMAVVGADSYTKLTSGLTVSPNLTFITDEYYSPGGNSTTLVPPTSSEQITPAQGGGFFGPNFTFSSTSSVPEPSSLAFVGFGIASMVAYGWRRRRNAVAAAQAHPIAPADAQSSRNS